MGASFSLTFSMTRDFASAPLLFAAILNADGDLLQGSTRFLIENIGEFSNTGSKLVKLP
jgi:hypothetical protein